MTRLCFPVLAITASLLGGPVHAGDSAKAHKVVSEAMVKRVSDLTYTEILGQTIKKGWRYTPEQMESGYRRHFEEFKLRLIDQGYIILVGEVGA